MKKIIFSLISCGLLALVLFFVCPVNLKADYQQLPSGITDALFDITFVNQTTGYAVGAYGAVIKTTNGGTSWFSVTTGAWDLLQAIYFLNPNTGYIVGDNGVFLKTTNAGQNWTMSFPTSGLLKSVYFIDENTGYIAGMYSCCMKTTNGGANWTYQTLPENDEYIYKVIFNQGKGFLAIISGTTPMYTTTDGGVTWVSDKNKFRNGTADICFADICFCGTSGMGYAIGNQFIQAGVRKPVMFKTNNNGDTWTEITLPNRQGGIEALAIAKNNPNYIYAAGFYFNDPTFGNKGLILASTNGGANFQETQWGTGSFTFFGATATETSAFFTGQNGTLVTTVIPIGITPISTEVPSNFSLKQNYPNPFNPTTNINFSVTKTENVTIKVFDITGREVTTLVNEKMTPGSYKVDFNGSALTSGTYFYRMTAGTFTETKKMMLIK